MLLKSEKTLEDQDLMEDVFYSEILLSRIVVWKEVQYNHQNQKIEGPTKSDRRGCKWNVYK